MLFVVIVGVESADLDYDQASNASASAEFAVSWVYALCVAVLAGMAAVAGGLARRGRFTPRAHEGLWAVSVFTALLALSWPLVVTTVYLAPRVL